MQNSRKNSKLKGENLKTQVKIQGLVKFYSHKVENKCQIELMCA